MDDSNPKDAYGDKKPDLSLIPPVAMLSEAKVMQLGAKKYGPYNWRAKKVRVRVYTAAAMRHILAWQDGTDIDPESGESHLAHARACMGILLDAIAQESVVDDRVPIRKAERKAEPCSDAGPSFCFDEAGEITADRWDEWARDWWSC